jgi:hypothetical protein
MKPSIPARTLAHLQIAAAAHLGGDLGQDAARPAFIGIREFDYLVGLPERRRLAGKQFYASLASPIA